MKVKPSVNLNNVSHKNAINFLKEAKNRKLPIFTIQEGWSYQVGLGEKLEFIIPMNSHRGALCSNDKYYTSEIAESCGISVPRHVLVEKKTSRDYKKLTKGLKFPLVVKPTSRSLSLGVTLGIKNNKQLKKAISYGFKYDNKLIIEEFIDNALDYRLTFFRGKFLGAIVSIPQFITGDGKSKINELIKKLNSDRRKKYGLKPRTMEWVFNTYIAQHNYTLSSILSKGRSIKIYSGSGLYKNITQKVHPENVELCRNICQISGLEFSGVDFISPDASVPFYKNGAVINETNSYPDTGIYSKVIFGEKIDIANKIIKEMFPSDKSAWIPIFYKNNRVTDFAKLKKLFKKKPKTVFLKKPDRKIEKPRLLLLNYLLNKQVKRITL